MKSKVTKEIFDWVICFLVAYVIYLFINFFIGTISGIKQVSMLPTAKEGERVVITRRVLFSKNIKRGDIITVEAPFENANSSTGQITAQYKSHKGLSWITYNFMGIGKMSYIKRIIALEGEHLLISKEGKVYINGDPLIEEYLTETTTPITGDFFDLTIPKGCVFVMGDNRDESRDSRELGVIPINKIEGKVKMRVWPIKKLGAI